MAWSRTISPVELFGSKAVKQPVNLHGALHRARWFPDLKERVNLLPLQGSAVNEKAGKRAGAWL
jgi:hypothetical protein